MVFNESQENFLDICSAIFSLLSLLSSVTVLGYYITFRGLRKYAFKLVAWTALSDAIRCLGNLMGSPERGDICRTQGFLKTFGGVASLLWVGFMAFTINLIILQKLMNLNFLMRIYHMISWTTAGIAAFLPLAFNAYQPTGGWCWISKNGIGAVLRWTSFYAILWFLFLWISYVYIYLWCYVKGLPHQDGLPRSVSRLWIYPVILLICYGPASVRRVWEIIGTPPFWLAVLHICFGSLHGTLNALAYGRNEDVRLLTAILLDMSCGTCMGRSPQERRSSNLKFWKYSKPAHVDIFMEAVRMSRNNMCNSYSVNTESYISGTIELSPSVRASSSGAFDAIMGIEDDGMAESTPMEYQTSV